MRLHVVSVAVLGSLGGACRGNFDAQPDAALDAPVEPPLPAMVCAKHQVDISPVAADSDLAVTNDTDQGYVAAWVDPTTSAVAMARFDRRYVPLATGAFAGAGATKLAGIEVRPQRVWVVTAAARQQTLWNVASGLGSAASVSSEETVPGSDPIGASLSQPSAMWIRGSRVGAGLQLAYLTADGAVAAPTAFVTQNPVTAISATDYEDHIHLAWREANGRCMGADVDFEASPQVASPEVLTTDCTELRIVSGPPPHDPLVTAWTNAAQEVWIKYQGASSPQGGRFFEAKVGDGTSPRITFDGEAYWLAWQRDGAMQIARVNSSGEIQTSTIAAFTPVGAGAFELVRRGISVDLVSLTSDKLVFLSLCPL